MRPYKRMPQASSANSLRSVKSEDLLGSLAVRCCVLDVRFQLSAFSVSAFRWSHPQLSTINAQLPDVAIVCCCKELLRPPFGIAKPARECQK
jgi:hypothetical protein